MEDYYLRENSVSENINYTRIRLHGFFINNKRTALRITFLIGFTILFIPFMFSQDSVATDSLNVLIDKRLEKIVNNGNINQLDRAISVQNNISGELSNLLSTVQFLFALVGALATLILFAFSMYYRKEIRDKLNIATAKLEDIDKIKTDFDLIKKAIEIEFKEIQKYKSNIENITEELSRLRSRVQKSELKEKLYGSFSSDELNQGIFPKKDIKTLEKIVEVIDYLESEGDPVSSKDLYYKGLYYFGKKEYEDAIEVLKKAIILKQPDFYYEAYNALSASLNFSKQYIESINCLLKMLDYKKGNKTILTNLVYSYMKNKDFELAHQYCDLLDQNDINYILAKSEIYLREGLYSKSLEWIKKSGNNNYHRLRGRILFHSEQYEQSNVEFQTKIETIDKVLSTLGNSYYDIDKRERYRSSKASIFLLIACNYFKIDKKKHTKSIVQNYYSAISIDVRFSTLSGIKELEEARLNSFSKIEKNTIASIRDTII